MAKGNTLRKERKARVPVNASRPRTRGQRGKLHDPAANTAELTTQLRSMGLYAAPTLGDGNCLFRALSDQIYGTPNEHLALRKEICAFMAAHKERFEAFVDDDRSWDQHISSMRNNGTYGGHLELTAFAQLKVVNVKVVQPGLVYVIEGAKIDIFGPSTSTGSAAGGEEAAPASSKDKRKAKKERLKKKAAERAAGEDSDDDDDDGSPPFPATVYVAYHDWEHFSSVRNLIGPHQGMPDVCEVPEPDTSFLPSPPPSQAATKRGAKQKPQSQSTTSIPPSKQSQQSRPPTPSDSLSPPPSRSPKRAIDEEDEDEDEIETRKRNRRGTITVTPPEDDDEHEDEESEFATGVSSSVSAESGSFISDAPPPPPPEPEPKSVKGKRKSLGVPKARSSTQQRGRRSVGAAVLTKGKASNSGTSEGPKRETRSATKAYRDAGKVRDVGTGEWLDNGTGRLDVRGFRELRI
ncbi:OTU domain-containing protein 3 OS=Homo sapiens GN=OTUD3 PE=1 SV=1 [Rhizoctonia solani AG-1 IB]|uniref:OTU domain-containing protein 3 n=1 Tax=Thanatephorus cucumeris (strain AG1-IB / isolate 7/3/14) TaxID=1108050 RepID=A0A0B7FWJ3_THACB|nr:OTU domain-containing protein 3 OS=Homo sapiens GN=OTUD3 PE=1 SV=1 [Rhizoctonia solani AG-1 IB]